MKVSLGRRIICMTQGHIPVTAQMPRAVDREVFWLGTAYMQRSWVFDTPEKTFCARCKVDL